MEVMTRHPKANALTNNIPGTNLKWKAIYAPKSRRVVRKEITLGSQTYVLRRTSGATRPYRISVESEGRAYDLGEYRVRREAERRLLDHQADRGR